MQPSREGYHLLLDKGMHQVLGHTLAVCVIHRLRGIELALLEYRDQAPYPVFLLKLGPGHLYDAESVVLPVLQVCQGLDVTHHAVSFVPDLDGLPLTM